MDQKQQWEWCMHVFDIKSNGLPVELFQIGTLVKTIVVNKDIPLGLGVSVNTATTKAKKLKLTVG